MTMVHGWTDWSETSWAEPFGKLHASDHPRNPSSCQSFSVTFRAPDSWVSRMASDVVQIYSRERTELEQWNSRIEEMTQAIRLEKEESKKLTLTV